MRTKTEGNFEITTENREIKKHWQNRIVSTFWEIEIYWEQIQQMWKKTETIFENKRIWESLRTDTETKFLV